MADERATDDERTLLDAVQSYFDALYNGDTELFATVMHPNIRLYCPTPEPPLEMDLDAYLARFAQAVDRPRVEPSLTLRGLEPQVIRGRNGLMLDRSAAARVVV